MLLEAAQQSPHIHVRRQTIPTTLEIDEKSKDHGPNSYPLRVELKSTWATGSSEVIQAKYLLGCDGAHSWVRQQLGLKLEGTSRDVSWGVLDAIPMTDFRTFLIPDSLG